jgi:hypothetical protein
MPGSSHYATEGLGRPLALLLFALLLSTTFTESFQLVPRAEAASSSASVYVGFADDINESSSIPFPSPSYPFPWCGSADVTVIGDCSSVEAGVIMISNTGTSSLSVDNVTVFLPVNNTEIAYNDLTNDGDLVISPGHAVILSQGSESFSQQSYDTSAYSFLPPCSAPAVGGGLAPEVILGVGGKNTTYVDVNHVLDTGGSDLGACHGSDETTQWEQVFPIGTPVAKVSGQLQSIAGTYASQTVSGDNWNFTNAGVCGSRGSLSQCEGSSVGLSGISGLSLLDSMGNHLPFSGSIVSSGIALGGCQHAFRKFPDIKSGYGSIASCFDFALVTPDQVVGSVNMRVKIELPLSVTGPSCGLLNLEVGYLNGKTPQADGELVPATPYGVKGDNAICGINITQDAATLATSALGAAGHSAFTIIEEAPLSIGCSSPVPVGSWVVCKAVVSGTSASGTVSWSNGGSQGTFNVASTCQLKVGTTHSKCAVKYKATAWNTPVVLTADYQGDSSNLASSNQFPLAVNMKASRTKVSCTPSSLQQTSPVPFQCSAKVRGYTPTGKVTWAPDVSLVSFPAGDSCNLAYAPMPPTYSCSVQISPNASGAGTVKLTITYMGDLNNMGSTAHRKLTILP